MSFVICIIVPLGESDFGEKFLDLENEILRFPKYIFSLEEKNLIIYNKDFIDTEDIKFSDYIELGKIIKKFLIQNNFADENSYKNFFLLKKIPLQENITPEKLDNLLVSVDKNDEKLQAALQAVKKLKK